MNKYSSPGFYSVVAESMKDAAEIFATRAARRSYGRSAYCRTLNQEYYAENGSFAGYSAFVGRKSDDRTCTVGHNFCFSVCFEGKQ
jgi:hypothetical protein